MRRQRTAPELKNACACVHAFLLSLILIRKHVDVQLKLQKPKLEVSDFEVSVEVSVFEVSTKSRRLRLFV